MTPYPPAPWRLQGGLYGSLWRLDGPAPPLPSGVGAVRIGGEALVATAFAVYRPGGTLTYNELLCGWVARRALRLGVSIDRIWVDSPPSMAGGRSLWAIPKQLAAFTMTDTAFLAAGIAEARFTPGPGAPGRWPLQGWTLQQGPDGPVETRMSARGRLRLARAQWGFAPDGPLAFLSGRTPVLSLMLEPMRIQFG